MSDRLMGRSAYEVLGVPTDATTADLKRAYRRRMRQHHPDLGGDPEAFALVQVAWAQVQNPRARAEYDRRRGGGAGEETDNGERVWSAGTATRSARTTSTSTRSRSYGHPGGWSRQRYLTLIREWVGRGVDVPDPYAPSLVRRAPREIRHLLADAVAEEATATALGSLGSAFTLWHDVVAPGRARESIVTVAGKIDHIVLGPTGLFAIQSEDWGAPVHVGGRDLIIEGLPVRERPMRSFAELVKPMRRWRVRVTALVIVLPDEHLEADQAMVGPSRGPARLVVRRSAVPGLVRRGAPGRRGLDPEVLFDWRTRLQRSVTFI